MYTVNSPWLIEDHYIRSVGLYLLWTILFVVNIVILLTDETRGMSRDFNIITSLLSTIYPAFSSANTIYGNKLPSSLLMITGPIHQYAFWMLLCYYEPKNVITDHGIGYMNGVYTGVVGIFSLDMIIKTWQLAYNPQTYLNYVRENTPAPSSDV